MNRYRDTIHFLQFFAWILGGSIVFGMASIGVIWTTVEGRWASFFSTLVQPTLITGLVLLVIVAIIDWHSGVDGE